MVEKNFSEVTPIGQVVLEEDFASEGNMTAEIVPTGKSDFDCIVEVLVQRKHGGNVFLSRFIGSPGPSDFLRNLLYGGSLPDIPMSMLRIK